MVILLSSTFFKVFIDSLIGPFFGRILLNLDDVVVLPPMFISSLLIYVYNTGLGLRFDAAFLLKDI